MTEVYNKVPEIFLGRGSQKGFTFSLVKRENNIAVYKKTHQDVPSPIYETVIIKPHEAYKMGPMLIPAGENYPGDNLFGIRGFTYHDLSFAEKKFDELCKKYNS